MVNIVGIVPMLHAAADRFRESGTTRRPMNQLAGRRADTADNRSGIAVRIEVIPRVIRVAFAWGRVKGPRGGSETALDRAHGPAEVCLEFPLIAQAAQGRVRG